MSHIECLKTGILYRNPVPHLKSEHAYFPSVVRLQSGELLASMALGEAFESSDQRVYLSRSSDEGETWGGIAPLATGTPGSTSEGCRIGAADGEEVAAFLVRYDRSRRGSGLANEENLGFVETSLALMRSRDGGRTWDEARFFEPPLVGPSFELCSPIVILGDGRWIIPTSTWRGWDGSCPNGMKAITLVSHDGGRSWPEYLDVMANVEEGIIYWESKILELPDRRLLAAAWAYDERAGRDLANHYALSDAQGVRFGAARSTGLQGQTLTPLLLEDGRILSAYRRTDKPGLWANLSRIEGERWINEAELPLWGYEENQRVAGGANMVKNFNVLRFGAPSMVRLSDGVAFVAFWAVEDCVANIRWFKLRVEEG